MTQIALIKKKGDHGGSPLHRMGDNLTLAIGREDCHTASRLDGISFAMTVLYQLSSDFAKASLREENPTYTNGSAQVRMKLSSMHPVWHRGCICIG